MIRLANENDAMRIAELIVYGWRFAYSNIIDEKFLYKNLSVVKRYNSLIETLKNDHNFYVYEDNEIIKGIFLIGDSREEDDKNIENDNIPLELIAIYVEPAFKHQGIGSKLIEECETIAKSKDKSEIKLWVLEDNAIARAFYEKHGFELTDSKKKLEQLGVYEVRYEKLV
ncbi:MAG: GNAT family N-acetyltransferase [Clostridiales bacterium]|nr:GNAT family N-acetyltransferase [Clostridiales bacterium]